MATLGALGDLVLSLSADTAKFQADLGRADRLAKKFGQEIGRSFGTLANQIALLAGASGFGALIKSQIDAADAAGKMAQKFGLSVETFSAFKYAADLSDVSIEQLGTGLRQLAKNMADTQAGTGEAKDAFQALGLSVIDSSGKLKSSETQLLEIAEKFAKMEDGAGKTALAMRLFGRSGTELIPFLNQGRAGIEELRKEAERLGVVFSEQDAKAAEEFNDNLKRLQTQVKGIAVDIAGPLVDALNKAAKAMKDAKAEGEGFWGQMIEGFRALVTGNDIDKWNKEFTEATEKYLKWQAAVERAKNPDLLENIFGVGLERATAEMNKAKAEVDRLQAIKKILLGEERFGRPEIPLPPKTTPPALPAKDKDRDLVARQLEEGLEEEIRIRSEAAALTDAFRAQERENLRKFHALDLQETDDYYQAGGTALIAYNEERIRLIMEQADKELELAIQQGEAILEASGPSHSLRLEGLRQSLLTEEELENEAHTKKLEQLLKFSDEELEALGGRQAVIEQMEQEHQDRLFQIRGRALRTLNQFTKASWVQQAQTIFGELANITAGVAMHDKKMFELNKVAGIANAIINAYIGISKTLSTYPYPLNIAMAAAHAVAAFAQVNAIRSASFGGTGGAAPSLVGSTPATPVTPVTSGAPTPGQTTVINLQGDDSLLSTRQVRQLLKQIEESTRGGGRVVVA